MRLFEGKQTVDGMSILSISLSVSTSPQNFSSLNFISGHSRSEFLAVKFSNLRISTPTRRFETMKIRMGGGPRTYPGGVSKWQWKRMQAKKSKQLLKARLSRERQIYEMRKRAELKAAVSELERPWEVVENAPNLFSVSADEHLKVLADRFQRPGGFDMWSDRDGPELFKHNDGLPSARFFPKGVVHSIKPYGKIENLDSDQYRTSSKLLSKSKGERNVNAQAQRQVFDENIGGEEDGVGGRYLGDVLASLDDCVGRGKIRQKKITQNTNNARVLRNKIGQDKYRDRYSGTSADNGDSRDQNDPKRYLNYPAEVGYRTGKTEQNVVLKQNVRASRRIKGVERKKDPNLDAYDMRLQQDGRYEYQKEDCQ